MNVTETIVMGYRTAAKDHMSFGFPPGVKLTDLVPEDMKQMVHPHWNSFPPVNPMWHYLLGTAYIFLGFISLTGNGVVINLFTSTKYLRSTANMFVVNLAVSDFCMMLSQTPFYIHNCFNGGTWLFGPFLCELYAFLGSVTGNCSICTMAVIAYDRYNVIVNGMNRTRMTTGRAVSLIMLCWIWATAWSITPFFGWGKYIPEGILDSCSFDYLTRDTQTMTFGVCLFIALYCVPVSFIVYCYFFIVRTIFEHEDALREQAKKMNVASLRSNANANEQSAEIRIAKVALMNISLWVMSWTPYAVIVLQGLFGNQANITPLVTTLPALLAKACSVWNPIVYAISHPKFRLALQEKYPWFCVHETRSHDDSVSTSSGVTMATDGVST